MGALRVMVRMGDAGDPPAPAALPQPSAILPHRAPALFLSRVTSCEEEGATGAGVFPESLELLSGHFPGRPMIPGVLLFELAAQLVAYWAISRYGGEYVLLTGLDRARLRAPVGAGEELTLQASIERVRAPLVRAKVVLSRGDQRVGEVVVSGYLEHQRSTARERAGAGR